MTHPIAPLHDEFGASFRHEALEDLMEIFGDLLKGERDGLVLLVTQMAWCASSSSSLQFNNFFSSEWPTNWSSAFLFTWL